MKKALTLFLALALVFNLSISTTAALPNDALNNGTDISAETENAPDMPADGTVVESANAYTPSDSSASVYLNQLNEDEAAVYQTILSNFNSFTPSFSHVLDPYKDVVDGGKSLTNIAYRAYEAVYRDHPEIFWVPKTGGMKISLNMTDTAPNQQATSINMSVTMGKADTITKKKAALEAEVSKILQAAPNTVYERLKYFHDTIVNNCDYDTPAKNNPNAFPESYESYGCLINKKAVCEGYAKAFKMLCDRSGIPCVLVGGTSKNEAHMWNYVMIDGNYYLVDCTFDDPIGGSPTLDNFLKGSDTSSGYAPTGSFLQGFNSNFKNPTLNPTAYPTSAGNGGTVTPPATPDATSQPAANQSTDATASTDSATDTSTATTPAAPKQASPTSATAGNYYTVNYDSKVDGGTFTVSYLGGIGAVDRGQVLVGGICLTVNAYPRDGYKVSEIKADMGEQSASVADNDILNFAVLDNCTITVTFTKI